MFLVKTKSFLYPKTLIIKKMKITKKDLTWKQFWIVVDILDICSNGKRYTTKKNLAKKIGRSKSDPYFIIVFEWMLENNCITFEEEDDGEFIRINFKNLKLASHELDIPTKFNERYAKKYCDRSFWRGE